MTLENESAIAEMTQTFHQQNSAIIHINPNPSSQLLLSIS